jgi:opacity protein-like surface antigen
MKTKATLFALTTLLLSSSAFAADINGGSLKDTVDETSFGRNPFSGFYIGLNAGGEFANIDVMDSFDGIGADGLIGGIHAGYNMCANRFCFGPYVEGGLSNVNVDIGGLDALTQDYYVQGGAMVGYMVGKATLISVHAGYDHSAWGSDLFGGDDITVGAVAIGGGIETMITSNVSLGAKVDYLMVYSADVGNTDVTDFIEESEAIRAQLKLTYRR